MILEVCEVDSEDGLPSADTETSFALFTIYVVCVPVCVCMCAQRSVSVSGAPVPMEAGSGC